MEICPKCGYSEKRKANKYKDKNLRKASKYKDQNFKIIREGDIIKTPANHRFVVDANFKNLEHWINERGAYCLCDCWLEVIGDIYDNPRMKYSEGHGDLFIK